MKFNIKVILFVAINFMVTACSKVDPASQLELTKQMLEGKTWLLDYTITQTGTNAVTKTYVGQSTYFINFLKDNSTKDSDGIVGVYSIEKLGNQLQIHVNAKTNGSNSVEYIYNIESVGTKELIVFHSANNQTIKRYFSVR
ncbi:MAG: hypothetical protein ACO21H_01810 [Sediminibacterium sp.]|jgi:hypothetical protein